MRDDEETVADPAKVFTEFECPECNAHNPYPDGFRVGSEVLCFYCGASLRVGAVGSRLKLKSV